MGEPAGPPFAGFVIPPEEVIAPGDGFSGPSPERERGHQGVESSANGLSPARWEIDENDPPSAFQPGGQLQHQRELTIRVSYRPRGLPQIDERILRTEDLGDEAPESAAVPFAEAERAESRVPTQRTAFLSMKMFLMNMPCGSIAFSMTLAFTIGAARESRRQRLQQRD